jgi:hypothetical protein
LIVLTAALTLVIALGVHIVARADLWRRFEVSYSAGLIAGTLIGYCLLFVVIGIPLMLLAWYMSSKNIAATRIAGVFSGIILIGLVVAADFYPRASRVRDTDDTKLLVKEAELWAAQSRSLAAQFQNEMNAIAGKGLLAPEQLDSAEEIGALRVALQKMRSLVKRHHDANVAFLDSMPVRIRGLKISERSKEDAVAGYLSTAGETKAALKEWLQVEFEGVDRMGKLGDFMESRLGQFRIEDNTIVFQEDKDVDSYNKLLARINEIVEKEKELSAKQQRMSDEARDSMLRIVK